MNSRLEQIAMRTATGRRWMALWIIKKIRPMPRGMTMDDVDHWLGDADVEQMRREVEAWTRRLER